MSKFSSRILKGAFGALALATLSTGFTAVSATTADAQWGPRPGFGPRAGFAPRYGYGPRYGYRRGAPRGAAVAAGVIGGLAAGALIAGATQPAYAAPVYGGPVYSSPGYYQPAYEPSYAYQPTCYTRKVRQVVDYDTVVIRRVRVCE